MRRRQYTKILRNREERIERRLSRRNWKVRAKPMMSATNIRYEVSGRIEGMGCGGIGAIHQLAQGVGLVDGLNRRLRLLERHSPYFESDHVLNIAYNVLVGGQRLEDIEIRRQDVTFLNALGAWVIPDPTNAGDFTRRFTRPDIERMMDCINEARQVVWRFSGRAPFEEALIDIDGTVASTYGECKQGMEYSYQGSWGYHPVVVTLANTGEVLYLENRPGNVASHQGAVERIDQTIALLGPHALRICLRGDTAFFLTQHFDRWSDLVDFVFGMDASQKALQLAQALPDKAWDPLKRQPKYQVQTQERRKPENVKDQIVRQREFEKIRLISEHVAEFAYRPGKCKKDYRVVVCRKNLSIERGEDVLFPDVRYFYYITNRKDLSAAQVVELANGRCNQENVIEQLKNGVNAMRMPVNNLLSNWAYMVMAALAWNLKAWFAMLVPDRESSTRLLRMEFRQFLNSVIRIPCQIVRTGRRIIYRVLAYNAWLRDFLLTWENIRRLNPA